jgi:L-methionine (R)-S-oxide reductase
MHAVTSPSGLTKAGAYREMNTQLGAVLAGESNGLANAANMAAILWQSLPDLNWAGFYFMGGGGLVLGPFQGKVACVRIAVGKGVCGTAAERRETIIVPDVSLFPGHITCDSASRSEIVVPIVHGGKVLGVLDLDSPSLARFDREDAAGLSEAVGVLLKHSDLSRLVD